MKAWLLEGVHNLSTTRRPLRRADIPERMPGEGEVLIKVSCCGICHTELDEIEGRTPPARYPVVPGHQVIGYIAQAGKGVNLTEGVRVGAAWIYNACGTCTYCTSGRENLCPQFKATGRDAHGGYADFLTISARYVYPIPEYLTDPEAAPLLCAGAIGYRSVMLSGIHGGKVLGLAGFGASNHLVLRIVKSLWPDVNVWVFARSRAEQELALQLGASWANDYSQVPPQPADAIIDTTPVWKPVLTSLLYLKPGGRLIINAIRKELGDVEAWTNLDYARHLWMEKEIKSVANITAADVRSFLAVAEQAGLRPVIKVYPMEEANQALWELKNRPTPGAKVLMNS